MIDIVIEYVSDFFLIYRTLKAIRKEKSIDECLNENKKHQENEHEISIKYMFLRKLRNLNNRI